MKRHFVYTTAALPTTNSTQSPPLKRYKPFEENNDFIDDDELDAIGTQALEQFENNNGQLNDQCASTKVTSSIICHSLNAPCSSASYQPDGTAYRQISSETTEDLQLESALKQIKLLEQKVKLLQDEKYTQVGEVKILRERLNQAEANSKELTLLHINNQSKLKLAEREKEWAEEKKKLKEHIASLSSTLKFKEQEASAAAYEKCKCLVQQNKTEISPPQEEEMRVQSNIKVTPVSARCRDGKNAQKHLNKNFNTDFPTSDPLKAFSQLDATSSNGYCNKGKLKPRIPQQKYNKAQNCTSSPVMHSTPVVDQETQTPVDILRQGRIEDGIASVELGPSLTMNGRQLFNHLVSMHPWLSQSCKHQPSSDSSLTPTHGKDHGMSLEADKGEEDYFVSLELPTSTISSPFLRDPVIQHDLQQSLANLLGSPYLPILHADTHLLPNMDTVNTKGDLGISLLLVLEKLIRKYCFERTGGRDGHCKSVESWVSGSLEGFLPSFASLTDEVGHTSRDAMRMDSAQAIACIMEVLLDLVCHSRPVRCHILDNSGKPPLSLGLGSHCASADGRTNASNNDRTKSVDDGPASMECDNVKSKTPVC